MSMKITSLQQIPASRQQERILEKRFARPKTYYHSCQGELQINNWVIVQLGLESYSAEYLENRTERNQFGQSQRGRQSSVSQ